MVLWYRNVSIQVTSIVLLSWEIVQAEARLVLDSPMFVWWKRSLMYLVFKQMQTKVLNEMLQYLIRVKYAQDPWDKNEYLTIRWMH